MASSRQVAGAGRRILAAPSWGCLHRQTTPPTLSVTSSPTAPRRQFSIAPAITAAIDTTQDLLVGLHTVTGAPWFVAIPLIALSVNVFARLPLSIYTRRVLQRRINLTPLTYAWYHRHARDIQADHRFAALSGEKRNALIQRRYTRTISQLYSRFGVQKWKDYSGVAVFPVWLVGIESLRRLCGGPRGLIGSLALGRVESGGDVVAAGSDLSLATGGCLWFPDLMVADPLHILPFALSAVMICNIMPRTLDGLRLVFGKEQPGGNMKGSPRLTRALIVVAAAIGPVTMDMPAALHLYWLSSSTIALIQNELINRYMPLPKQPRPCKPSEYPFPRPRREEGRNQNVEKEP